MIGKVDYSLDSNSEWIGVIADDMVSDSLEENFTVMAEDVKAGEHVLTIRVADDIGNVTYKSFEFSR